MRLGHGMALCALALLVAGVVMVTSAGLELDAATPLTLEGILLGRPALYAALALGMLWLGSIVPVDRLYTLRGGLSPIPWLVIGMIVLLLAVHLPVIGKAEKGAHRWINLGLFTFQPSEFAKWALPIVVAWHCCRRAGTLHRLRDGFLPPIAIAAVVCGLIAVEDLGTAVLVFAVCVAMLVAAGCRLRYVAGLAAPALAGIGILIVTSPYRVNRILAYLDPFQEPAGRGYHVIQSIAAVAGGGISGRGIGNSVQKFGYLPEDTTDFIYAIVCEELGAAGALMIIALYAILLLCGLGILRRAGTPFARLLGLGIILTIGLQALMNLFVVTGLAPTKGIALPLLSRGGSGWLLTAFSIGLMLSIDRDSAAAESEGEAEDAEDGMVDAIDEPVPRAETERDPSGLDPFAAEPGLR
ncbi:MAG TPA: putative peptidoglycan glycosyltransferase FtsW [Phycisphaerales bacterium]|nr:putative peptidoglycan glycosyltransferase FtsW [Phycisphaerales bacterium]HMP37570.1 putative peptidoglycan glycosyltransferase FtsW [Phycisphaerales bacterium]